MLGCQRLPHWFYYALKNTMLTRHGLHRNKLGKRLVTSNSLSYFGCFEHKVSSSNKKMSDKSSGFDSADNSSVDNVPEATTKNTDEEIQAQSDSPNSSDNEQLQIQSLDDEQTAAGIKSIQPTQNDDCTVYDRSYMKNCRQLTESKKERSSIDKEGEHTATNVLIIDVGIRIHEQKAIAQQEGNSSAVICLLPVPLEWCKPTEETISISNIKQEQTKTRNSNHHKKKFSLRLYC